MVKNTHALNLLKKKYMVLTFFVLSNDMINYQATPDMSASKWYRLQESNANDVLNNDDKNQATIYPMEISSLNDSPIMGLSFCL